MVLLFEKGERTRGRGRGTLTTWVDEDLHWTVICVLVSQSDDNTGRRTGQRICISSDSMGRALDTYAEKQHQHIELFSGP